MAKGRHDEPQSSRTPLIVMTLGGIAVAALVVWALTRTVEPSATPAPASSTIAETSVPVTGVEPTATATTSPLDTATPPTTTPAPPHVEGDRGTVRRIAVEDLHAQMNRNAVTVIDVRDQTAFQASHIPGALHIPMASIEGEAANLPKDKPIVTYCT